MCMCGGEEEVLLVVTVSAEGTEMKLEVKLCECGSDARLLGELSHFCAPRQV